MNTHIPTITQVHTLDDTNCENSLVDMQFGSQSEYAEKLHTMYINK